jgi:DNA-binding transcriptional LysR family regulator
MTAIPLRTPAVPVPELDDRIVRAALGGDEAGPPSGHPGDSVRGAATVHPVVSLRKRRDYVLVVALCERLLDSPSEPYIRPPGHDELRERLAALGHHAYTTSSMRTRLSQWRAWMGLPSTQGSNCSCALAVAAVQAGLVTLDDVLEFRRGPAPART